MNDLSTQRVQEITRLHGEIAGALRMTLDKGIRVGELLTAQKGELQHGEWGAWCEEHLPFDERTARRYMLCWRERDRIKTDSVSDLTSAYRLLEQPRGDSEPETLDDLVPLVEWYAGEMVRFSDAVRRAVKGEAPLPPMLRIPDSVQTRVIAAIDGAVSTDLPLLSRLINAAGAAREAVSEAHLRLVRWCAEARASGAV